MPWTQNLYTYVGNNPVNYIDPTGHDAVRKDDGSLAASGYVPGLTMTVLTCKTCAADLSHGALVVQDGTDAWYYSFAVQSGDAGVVGDGDLTKIKIAGGASMSVDELVALVNKEQRAAKNLGTYDKGLTFAVSTEQVAKAQKNIDDVWANRHYHLLGSNCIGMVDSAFNAAGFESQQVSGNTPEQWLLDMKSWYRSGRRGYYPVYSQY